MINKGPAKINILIENSPKASLTSFIGHILAIFQVARKSDNDCELLGCRAGGLHWKEWEEHIMTETFFPYSHFIATAHGFCPPTDTELKVPSNSNSAKREIENVLIIRNQSLFLLILNLFSMYHMEYLVEKDLPWRQETLPKTHSCAQSLSQLNAGYVISAIPPSSSFESFRSISC